MKKTIDKITYQDVMSDIRSELQHLKEQLIGFKEIAYSFDGGDIRMEQLKEKINDIDKKLAVLEERTKKLDDLPTRDELKNIVYDSIERKELATKSDVELQVIKARNTQIIWTVGTIAVVAGVIVRFF